MTQSNVAHPAAPLDASPRRLSTAIDAVLAVASIVVMLAWFAGHPVAYTPTAPVMSPFTAVSRGGPAGGALAMLLFGLGTAPALLGVSLADDLLARRRAILDHLARLFLLGMGAWFIWTGVRG
jgi:sulfite exporter TauE/SafE